jgi:hypothetical protein
MKLRRDLADAATGRQHSSHQKTLAVRNAGIVFDPLRENEVASKVSF